MQLVTVEDTLQGTNNAYRMTPEERTRVGRKLAAIRHERKLDQRQVAKLKSVSLGVGTVQAIENNLYEVKESNIEKLAKGLGTSLDKILREIRRQSPLTREDFETQGLNEEHLEIAKGYMRARRSVRERIEWLLANKEDERLTKVILALQKLPPEELNRIEWLLNRDLDARLIKLIESLRGIDPEYLPVIEGMTRSIEQRIAQRSQRRPDK